MAIQHEFYNFAQTIKDIFVKRKAIKTKFEVWLVNDIEQMWTEF